MTTLGHLTVLNIAQLGPPEEGEFTYVDISSVDNQAKRISAPKRLQVVSAPSRARQRLRSGDVLVSMTRPNLNAVALVPSELDGAVGSTGFHVLRAADGVEPRWLFYAVQTRDFVEAMAAHVQGALYPAVRPKDIRSYPLDLPSGGEQRRIVAEIEKQFSRVDEAVASLKRVQANLKRYKSAVLKAAVEGKLTEEWRKQHSDVEPADRLLDRILAERRDAWRRKGKGGKYREPSGPDRSDMSPLPRGWTLTTLEQLAGHIVDGTHHTPTYVSDGVPFVSAKDIDNGSIDLVNCRRIPEHEYDELSRRCSPAKGDVLVTKSGTIGRVAVVRKEERFTLFESVALIPLIPFMNPSFLATAVETEVAGEFGKQQQKGVAVRHLHLEDLRRLPVRLPPGEEQRAIEEGIAGSLSVVAVLQKTVQIGLARADRLRQAILQKAFSGQLVPQDPDDEPASALLERIRAGRRAAENVTNGRARGPARGRKG